MSAESPSPSPTPAAQGPRPRGCRKPAPRVTSQIEGRAPARGPPERWAGGSGRHLCKLRPPAHPLRSPWRRPGPFGDAPNPGRGRA